MKQYLLAPLLFCGLVCSAVAAPLSYLLPEDFTVYVSGNSVVNWPAPGYVAKRLPTFNHYSKADGGYIAIYTHQPNGAVYPVTDDIYVIGQIRVKGNYQGRILVPQGYAMGDNITQDPELVRLAESYFPHFTGQLWVGGDTGGWLGLQ